MEHQAYGETEVASATVNKWEALRKLSTARKVYGLSDRDMTVLQALISFHPGTDLGGHQPNLVVYPSNSSICDRLNGMPCSTMRRHLAKLVNAGIILRRDSPNGKRYARHYSGEKTAFGFDLAPLVTRFAEFSAAADEIQQSEIRLKRLRETASLMRRDLAGLAEYGDTVHPGLGHWDRFSDHAILAARALRRKLDEDGLNILVSSLRADIDAAKELLEPRGTEELSSKEAQSEQHYQNSDKEDYETETGTKAAAYCDAAIEYNDKDQTPKKITDQKPKTPNLPLEMILAACMEIQTYTDDPIRNWHDLIKAADFVGPMMGLSQSAWNDAQLNMGSEEAAVVVACILERFQDIRSPGGYLRHLSAKAALGEFSCGPMVMALVRREAA